jgi:pimeloyl-ACP methyl ester carboxylesterase
MVAIAMPEHILDLGDVRLCLESFGLPEDPTLLLISGAAESMDGWDPGWCSRLADSGRRVVRYDHRDTGRSTSSRPGHPSYAASELSRDVLRILDALDVDGAHLVGLSMGGGIAQEIAAHHPDRVATLTLIATSPAGRRADDSPLPPPEPRVAEIFDAPPPEPDWGDRHAVIDYLVESYRPYAGSLGFDEPATRRLAERVVDRTNDIEAATKNHWLVAGDEDDGFAMADIEAPTLVIHGTTDPLFPFAHGEALVREIGEATLLRVPGMGHERPPASVRGQVTEAILRHTRPRPLDDHHGEEDQAATEELSG